MSVFNELQSKADPRIQLRFLGINEAVNKYWIVPGPCTRGEIEEGFFKKGNELY